MDLFVAPQTHVATFSGGTLHQQLLQLNPIPLRRISVCSLECIGAHPNREEVVELSVAAAGRGVPARQQLLHVRLAFKNIM